MTTLTLIGKPDCHLGAVASEAAEASIQDDPALYEQWWEKIPVVLIDGRLHAHWRVSPDRLREALEEAVDAEARADQKELR